MDTHNPKNLPARRNRPSLDGLMNSLRRFARRCREADALIRRL